MARTTDIIYASQWSVKSEELIKNFTVSEIKDFLLSNAVVEEDEDELSHIRVDGKNLFGKTYEIVTEGYHHDEIFVTEDGRIFFIISLKKQVEIIDSEDQQVEEPASSEYVGKVKERLSLQVTFVNEFEYKKTNFTGFGTECHTIYIFKDASGNVFKVDTTSVLKFDTKKTNRYDEPIYHYINKGDVITIKGTVKEHTEYKGIKQTVMQRVNVTSIIFKAETPDERAERLAKEKEQKKQNQMDSIKNGDLIWFMPYKQYKESYSDCETVIDSYDSGITEHGNRYSCPRIKVIIRKGRLKNSGVRGKRFYRFEIMVDGQIDYFRAVSPENAMKQAKKEYPDSELKLVEVFTD